MRDMLALSRAESGGQEVNEPFDLGDAVSGIVEGYHHCAEQQSVVLDYVRCDEPVTIADNLDALATAVGNLVLPNNLYDIEPWENEEHYQDDEHEGNDGYHETRCLQPHLRLWLLCVHALSVPPDTEHASTISGGCQGDANITLVHYPHGLLKV